MDGYKFSQGKIVMDDQEITIIQIEKDEIENLSFYSVQKQVKKLNKKPNKGFASLMLSMNGYDDIPQELYEIDETRKYLQKLVKKIPHIIFYLSPINQMPTQVIASLADIEKVYSGPVSPEEYRKGTHQVAITLSQDHKDLMTNAIKKHTEKVGFEDKHEELSVIYRIINGK